MTAKEAVDKIKQIFADAPATQATTDLTTKDGKTLTCEGELKAGSKVVMKNPDGTAIPCPDGEYEMADGTKIKCAAGIIGEVVAPQAQAAAPAQPAATTVPTALEQAITQMQSDLKAFRDSFDAQKTESDAVINKLKEELAAFKTANEAFTISVKEGFKLVEQIAEQPAAAPIVPVKGIFAKDKDKEADRFSKMAAVISQIKNSTN